MIKLVLTDLDDTLIPFGASGASDNALAAIHELLDAGLSFGPVTGRLPNAMSWMFGGDESCYATGAFANGQLVVVNGRTVRRVAAPASDLQRAADLLDERDAPAWLAVYSEEGDAPATLVTRRPDSVYGNPPDTWGDSVRSIAPRLELDSYVKANIQCSCDRGEMVELRDMLRREVPGLSFLLPSLTARVIDVDVAGWGKGDGVRVIAESLGISMDEVAVFGDSENDLPMIEAVPNSVAVANASRAVADAARWHIGPAADDSVATAMHEVVAASAAGALPAFMTG